MRDYYPRTVPWTLVLAVWKALGSGLRYRSGTSSGMTMAWVSPLRKVLDMVHCLEGEDWIPDHLRPGELWVRWGCDGVPLWGRNYITLTASLGALGMRQPLQVASLCADISPPFSD